MKVGYTEFSFGYAFTENLIRSSATAPIGAPVFPNLIQEGKSGYDIRINFPGVPLFFQYKLPELMKRGTAFEIANGNCPGLSIPFFRIAMMRRDVSRQHELLIRLEARYPSNVFYATPCIANIDDFDKAYNAAAVARQSVFFSPTDIGPLPDDKAHSLAYKSGLPSGYFCSDPKPIKRRTFDELSSIFRQQFEEKRFNQIGETAREMRENVRELASSPMRQNEQLIADRVRSRRIQVSDGTSTSPEERASGYGHPRCSGDSARRSRNRFACDSAALVPRVARLTCIARMLASNRSGSTQREGWRRAHSKLFSVMRPQFASSESFRHPLVLGHTVK